MDLLIDVLSLEINAYAFEFTANFILRQVFNSQKVNKSRLFYVSRYFLRASFDFAFNRDQTPNLSS
ncbi:hypothetical protein MCEWOLH11_00891 [Candidatus Methylopumilus universalis]